MPYKARRNVAAPAGAATDFRHIICHSREPMALIDALYREAAFIKSIFWRARKTILSPALISPDTVHNRNATLSGSMRTVLQNLCSPNWWERGLIVEAEAADWYEFDQDVTVQRIGFITDEEHTMGCSPDRLVGDDGLLEIKAPLPHT